MFFDCFYNHELTLFWVIVGINSSAIWWDEFFIYICYFILSEWQSMQKYILIWRKRQTGRKWIKYCVRFLLLGLILLLGTILLCNRIIIHSTESCLYDQVETIPENRVGVGRIFISITGSRLLWNSFRPVRSAGYWSVEIIAAWIITNRLRCGKRWSPMESRIAWS